MSGETWRLERGSVRWEFELPARGTPRDHVPGVLAAAGGFAVLAGEPVPADGLVLELDCLLTDAGGDSWTIPGGASVTVGPGLEVALHTDVHARWTRGENPANEALAELNAPRLSAFLARLGPAVGARFVRVRAPSFYASQLSAHGFFERFAPGRPADVRTALETGRPMHLSDLPDDPERYVLMEEEVAVRRVAPGRYSFATTTVFHDGSATSSHPVEEFHDLPGALARTASLRAQGFSLELR